MVGVGLLAEHSLHLSYQWVKKYFCYILLTRHKQHTSIYWKERMQVLALITHITQKDFHLHELEKWRTRKVENISGTTACQRTHLTPTNLHQECP